MPETIDITVLSLSLGEIVLRFTCAMIIGAMIGIEREFTHRPAGLRTHMLVALGSCAVMVTSQLLFCQYRPYGSTPDPARLSAQVIAGVGFLGAGTIIKEGTSVKGLTTAASIWAVACLGIAVGAGYYAVALIGLGCTLVTLILFEWLQVRLFKNRYCRFAFQLECVNAAHILEKVIESSNRHDAKMTMIQVADQQEFCKVSFQLDFTGRRADQRHKDMLKELADDREILSVKVERLIG